MRLVAAVFFPEDFGSTDELFKLFLICQTGKNQNQNKLFGREY